MDQWATLNKSLYSFYTGSLSKFKTAGSYKTKKAEVSGGTNSAIKVTTDGKANSGSYKVKVKSTASAAYLTGADISSKTYTSTTDATNSTKIGDMFVDGKTPVGVSTTKESFSVAASVDTKKEDGSYATETRDVKIDIDANTTIADINSQLKNGGITGLVASMEKGKLVFTNTDGMRKNESGEMISNSNYTLKDESTNGILSKLGIELDTSNQVLVKNTVDNTDGKEVYSSSITGKSELKYKTDGVKLAKSSKLLEYINAQTHSNSDSITFKLTVGSTDHDLKIDKNTTVDDFCNMISKESGNTVSAGFDSTNQRFFISTTKTGKDNSFTLTSTDSNAIEALGLGTGSKSKAGTDAVILFNDAEMSSSTNDIKLDALGLTISVQSANKTDATGNIPEDKDLEEISVNVSNDTDTAYKMVKNFIKEYNGIVATLSEKYYADANKYEPLTDDEESELSDSEVEKWNKKVESAALRRDDKIGNILDAMRSDLASSAKIDNGDGTTSNYALSSFGIVTGSWEERGVLHLEGDADDSSYASKTDKLKAALESDPDKVMNTLSEVGKKLYDRMGNMMKSSSLNSSMTLYNDKSMKKQISEYDDDISTLQEKLEDMQDRYYSQFSTMESALSKLNSISSSMGFTQS